MAAIATPECLCIVCYMPCICQCGCLSHFFRNDVDCTYVYEIRTKDRCCVAECIRGLEVFNNGTITTPYGAITTTPYGAITTQPKEKMNVGF